MVFQKREEKNPNRKPKCPLSAYQKSKIIVNEVVRISHAKVAELPLSAAARCFLGSGRSLGSGEHQLDVWGAGHCRANSCSTKMALSEQVSAAVSTLLGTFHIPATEIKDGTKHYTSNLLSLVYMGISQGHFSQPRGISAECWSEKRTFCHPETAAAVSAVPDITQHTPKDLNHTEVTPTSQKRW